MNNTREKVNTTVGKVSDTDFSIKDGKVHIFPFIIRNGYQNVSQRGFEEKGVPSSYFSFFQKVFTGQETITATWEGSTELNVRDASLGTYDYDFQVGTYYEGIIVPGSLTHSLEIGDVNGNEGFLAMQNSSEVTVVFSRNVNGANAEATDWLPTEDDLFKLYIIPESELGYKWLYISNITSYTNPKNKEIILTEVTFTSLKDKLEQSGRAMEQYVQYAAPGEPYAFPYITIDGEVIVSPLRLNPEPVKYLQVELQGAAALSAITVFGRRIYWDSENLKWYSSPSKFLLPVKFVTPQANPLNKTSAPTKNFNFYLDGGIETRATTQWLTAIKNTADAIAPVKNMGAFYMGKSSEYESNKTHKSNAITSSQSYYRDYNDASWKPCSYATDSSYDTKRTFNTKGDMYCGDTVVYDTNDNMMQLLIKNSFIYMTQLVLPLSMTSAKPYMWSNAPIIGFWTRWFGDRAMLPNSINQRTLNLGYFIDSNIALMQVNAYNETLGDQVIGNLQAFAGEETPSTLTPQATNTTLAFELSDKVTFTDSAYYDQTELASGVDTVYLSQITKEDGTTYFHSDHSPLLINLTDNNVSAKHTTGGFVIDYVMVQALHIGKVKVSCFGEYTNDNMSHPIFTQTVMSNSMFEQNNIRNWTTNITLGTWDSNWSSGEITWPLAPQKKIRDATDLNIVDEVFQSQTPSKPSPVILYRDNTGVFPVQQSKTLSQQLNRCYIYKREQKYSNTLQYANLGITGVTDKTTFLNKIQALHFDVTGTTLHWQGNDIAFKHNVECDLNGKYINVNLSNISSIGEITVKQALGSINCGYNNPLDSRSMEKEYITFCIGDGSLSYPYWKFDGGYQQVVEIYVGVLDDGLVITITTETGFYGYGFIDKPYFNIMGWLAYGGLFSVRNANFKSQIKIPKFSFIEK